MNNLEKHLLQHIVNAKLEPTRLQDVSKTDWQPNTDTENQAPDVPTDWLKILINIFSATVVPIIYIIIKALLDLRKKGDPCADVALRVLKESISKAKKTSDPYDDAINTFNILKDLVEKLDADCKAKLLEMKEVKALLRYIGGKIGATTEEIIDMLKTSGKDGLIAFATQLLKAGAQNAAIRLWLIANGHQLSETQIAWIIGLGFAGIIALGVAIAAFGGALDLSVWGAPAGVTLNIIGGALVGLGIWLNNNQGSNNNNTA